MRTNFSPFLNNFSGIIYNHTQLEIHSSFRYINIIDYYTVYNTYEISHWFNNFNLYKKYKINILHGYNNINI